MPVIATDRTHGHLGPFTVFGIDAACFGEHLYLLPHFTMANTTLKEITKERRDFPHREGVYHWFIPRARRFWQWPRWVDVSDQLKHLSDEQLDRFVEETPNVYYARQVPLEDMGFDRFLKRTIRKRQSRSRLLALYGNNSPGIPGKWYDATVVTLVMVLGTAHLLG